MAEVILPADENDVLLWRDNFWCFRDELATHFLRTPHFRVIPAHCLEWLHITYELVGRLQGLRQAQSLGFDELVKGLSLLDNVQNRLPGLKRDIDKAFGSSRKAIPGKPPTA